MDADKLIKALSDAIPRGENPAPYSEYISLRLDYLQSAIDTIDWLHAGLTEWRTVAESNMSQAKSARAAARVAIGHLQAVLNEPRTHAAQQAADSAARDWLLSIGSEPR